MTKFHRALVRVVLPAVVGLVLLSLPVGRAQAALPLRGAPTSMGQAIIGFAPGTRPAVAPGDSLAGLPVTQISTNGNFVVVSAADLGVVRRAISGVRGVTYVEDNGVKRALAVPNDSRYAEQYGPAMMGFPTAWGQAGYGSSSVVVSLIDSGIRRTHQDFAGGRVRQGRDYVSGDNDPDDRCGHGTHTSGTVGATTNNATGVAGMSQATILPMKALDLIGGLLSVQCTGSVANISQAIMDSADQGAKVISMSIGGGASTTEENAVNYAWNRGVLLVAAAGNDGSANSVDYPAAYPNVIAVAALTSAKTRASYSDAGPQVDVAAPGSGVLSTYNSSDTAYSKLDGTSMATPHVAGALALVLSCAPGGTTPSAVRDALYATAEDLGTAGRDDIYGNGLARADRLVAQVCGGGGAGNQAPTAAFTSSTSGLTVNVNGSSSSDPNGDALTYAWNFGDGATATGVTASHTYAAAGTYTVTLTVDDGHGATNSTSTAVPVGTSADPDPATPTVTSGQSVAVSLSGTGSERFYKIAVPTGAGQLQVVMTGPACGLLSCALDADLYTRQAARPTDTVYGCRPNSSGNNETCTHASPAVGYWYLRVKSYSGSGSVNLKATVS
ncbi:MAG TPA: S8 family serine peptidase [Acidimicrobiales bacterium]|nr:S8 family serine peptidase [Acidimicrobiales bacterium]